jgi:SAM-dependent methyltransferase
MYRHIAEIFDSLYPHGDLANSFQPVLADLRRHFGERKRIRLLDLCCGTGRGFGCFARNIVDVEIVAVDSNPTMIEKARLNYPQVPRENFIIRNICELQLQDVGVPAFDVVLLTGGSVHHFDKCQRLMLFALAARLLQPAGLFMCDVIKRVAEPANSVEAVVKRPFERNGGWTIVMYVSQMDVNKIRHHSVVLQWEEGNGTPQVSVDSGVLFPFTVDDAQKETSSVGLVPFPISVNWEPSTYLAFQRGPSAAVSDHHLT